MLEISRTAAKDSPATKLSPLAKGLLDLALITGVNEWERDKLNALIEAQLQIAFKAGVLCAVGSFSKVLEDMAANAK